MFLKWRGGWQALGLVRLAQSSMLASRARSGYFLTHENHVVGDFWIDGDWIAF
jgi:hypothetical protein